MLHETNSHNRHLMRMNMKVAHTPDIFYDLLPCSFTPPKEMSALQNLSVE